MLNRILLTFSNIAYSSIKASQMKAIHSYILFISICISLLSCKSPTPQAGRIVMHANIWTGNKEQPRAEALAIAGDTILAIGSSSEILKFKGSKTEIIDLQGKFVSPGFIDSHVHLLMGGNSLLSVQLREVNSKQTFISKIAAFSKTLDAGTWIVEGNWDHTLWGGALPNKEWIDAKTQDNPVALYRMDGHMVFANSKALELAGIDKNTPEVPNGTILRDSEGNPTGILKSNAMNLLLDKIPPMTANQKEKAIVAANNYFLAQGITSVHDVDSLGTLATASALLQQNKLKLRIYSAKPLNRWQEVATSEFKNSKWIKTGIVKGFVDGSLGSHTAAFKEPYSDQPSDSGFYINSPDKIYEWISKADAAKLHIQVHAIGDAALHSLLNIYERVIKENGVRDRRLRIEHAQHLDPQDIKRFSELGIIASVQPYHAIDDGRWAEEYIGTKRAKTTYAFRSLADANTLLAFGSDWPVAPASPIYGIYAAVTRRTTDNKNPEGWIPEQKITAEEALQAYTINGAFASFDESTKGSLAVGKFADFVVLSVDITKATPDEILGIQVLATYLGGEEVYFSKK